MIKVAHYKVRECAFFWKRCQKSDYGKLIEKNVQAELEMRGCPRLEQAVKAPA